MRNIALTIFSFICCCAAATASPNHKAKVKVVVDAVFNGKPLVLSSQYNIDENGDTLYIDLVRFYLSRLTLTNNNSGWSDTNAHLIDFKDNAEQTYYLDDIDTGTYNSVSFIVGVDSVANVSGALEGDLDPAKGMYWAWNTGYIMAKIEGRSDRCKTLHQAFEFHIGGYMPPYNACKQVTMALAQPLIVQKGSISKIHIRADVAAWFKGTTVIDIAKENDVVIPGKDAMMVADNYAKMFSIIQQ